MDEKSDGDSRYFKNIKILFCTACRKLSLAIHVDGNFQVAKMANHASVICKICTV